jgi:hypothetical protein
MSISDSNSQFTFSPFHAVVHDGIDRLLEFFQDESFSFIVKGEETKLTLAEAVLISPNICERLKSDPTNREFRFGTDELEPQTFSDFVGLIRCRDEHPFL